MIEFRTSRYLVTTALAGGVLAGLFAPTAARAGCSFTGSQADNVRQFAALVAGTVNSVSSVVTTITTTDAALVAQGSSAFVAGSTSQSPNQLGGGVWVRGIGGNFLTSVPSNGSVSDTIRGTNIVETATTDCQTRVRQGFGGAQVGADVANLNLSGSGVTLHFGLTSGFVETSATSSPATNVDFQVPFFGLYSRLALGNFFADTQIRGNFFEGSITDSLNNIPGEKLNASGFTVSGNIGYRFDLPAEWFIEPSAGVNWSRTFVDSVSFQGTQIFLPPGFSPGLKTSPGPSNLNINDFDDILGRASLRVGTTLVNGQYIFQPFAVASVLHEFADPIRSTVIGIHNLDADFITTALSTSRIGTYGQFGLGVTGQIANSGMTGFFRGDYRTGSRFEGWSVTGGARYDFNPETAALVQGRSADVAGAPYVPAPYNWSGFFVGVSAPGALWGETKWSFPGAAGAARSAANNYSGLLAGGGGGYNYQMGALVVGGQVEWDWTNARGGESFSGGSSFSCPINSVVLNVPPGSAVRTLSLSCTTRANSIFTATARLGYALDRLLVYGQGGLAVGDVTAKVVSNSFAPGGTLNSDGKTAVGWTIGAGFEYGLTQNISAKAEYLYFDLGSDTYNLGVPVAINRTGNIGRVGLNYHFN